MFGLNAPNLSRAGLPVNPLFAELLCLLIRGQASERLDVEAIGKGAGNEHGKRQAQGYAFGGAKIDHLQSSSLLMCTDDGKAYA
jgi:hypothetical protein